MTEKPRAADPATTGSAPGGSASAGPANGGQAAERVVIRDKRRIDPAGGKARSAGSGKSATKHAPAAGGPAKAGSPAATSDPAPSTAPDKGAEDCQVAAVEQTEGREAPPATSGGEAGPDTSTPADGVRPSPLGAELQALRAELDERTRDLQRVTAEYANYRKRVDRDRGVAAEQTTAAVLGALLPVLDDLDRARDHGDLVGPFATVAEQLTTALGKFGLTAFGEKGDPFDPTRHEAVAHLTSAEVTEPTCIDVMRCGYLLGDRLLRPALVAVADLE